MAPIATGARRTAAVCRWASRSPPSPRGEPPPSRLPLRCAWSQRVCRSTVEWRFQQNLNHWYPSNPGYFGAQALRGGRATHAHVLTASADVSIAYTTTPGEDVSGRAASGRLRRPTRVRARARTSCSSRASTTSPRTTWSRRPTSPTPSRCPTSRARTASCACATCRTTHSRWRRRRGHPVAPLAQPAAGPSQVDPANNTEAIFYNCADIAITAADDAAAAAVAPAQKKARAVRWVGLSRARAVLTTGTGRTAPRRRAAARPRSGTPGACPARRSAR
jgi:hypothetical protein